MNIFKYEFKMYIKSIVIWSLSIVSFVFIMMLFFPTFSKDVGLLEKIMENYPEEMLKAFGMNSGIPLSNILGYLVFTFVFIQLCIAIQAANYGFSILSIEEREFTADFLMSKPVSRIQILLAKFIASFIALFITNLMTWFSVFATLEIFKSGQDYDVKKVVLLLSSIVLFQLFFLSFGMLVSVLTKKIRNVLSYSLALSFGTYILSAIGAILGGKTLGYFTPFSHFEAGYILENGHYNYSLVIISCIMIVFSLAVTVILYPRRDIHSL